MNVPTVPMLNPSEVEALRKRLALLAPGSRVLEWGAGGSTLYWPREFPELEWVTVEHDPAWAKAVRPRLPGNARLIERELGHAYWRLEEGTFDLIIVDGRERVRCMDAARAYLRPGGAVILHDSSRRRYGPGMDYYKHQTLLAQPTSGRDPRGMTMLTGPEPSVGPPNVRQGTTGAMYIAWGAPAITQAIASLQSLRRWLPDIQAVIVGDAETAAAFLNVPGTLVETPPVDPFKGQGMFGFLAGRVKPLLASLSPFERTLYVDADTEFKASPKPGFDLLDRWDFVIAEAETRSLGLTFPDNRSEAGDLVARLGTPHILYHNSGLFWWRNNQATTDLFRLWSDEWLRYQGWDEQIALLRALLASEAVWLNVPYTWNCRGPVEAYMVYHRFASRSARKFGGGGYTVVPHPRGVPAPPSRPLVRVEVSPGRYIRVLKGDEAKALAQFQRTIMAGRKARQGG